MIEYSYLSFFNIYNILYEVLSRRMLNEVLIIEVYYILICKILFI